MAICSRCGVDASLLRLLAEWFDLDDTRQRRQSDEVQTDLRAWARQIEAREAASAQPPSPEPPAERTP